MVSLWPWKGDDTSAAAFEKSLSALSTKIARSSGQLDRLRQRSRRFKALWTLYTSFAYLLCVIILALVVGWNAWGILEYSGLSGSPIVIYLVRVVLDQYYDYRISNVAARLKELQKERETTIEKLKTATKYNSTQQLLEKYGAAPQAPPSSSVTPNGKMQGPQGNAPGSNQQQYRPPFVPPLTANIPRNNPSPASPQPPPAPGRNLPPSPNSQARHSPPPPLFSTHEPGPPEFAPNAFTAPPQYSSSRGAEETKWYDRILDLVLGEDETLPKNRIVLICQRCRLVNGQAPPGIRRLEELGVWKCASCGAPNGEENETGKIVAEMQQQVVADIGQNAVISPSQGNSEEEDTVIVPVASAESLEDEQGPEVGDENVIEDKSEESPSLIKKAGTKRKAKAKK
ncbi:MAG: hypothetical protein M1829_006899 [Trizodia sp. TS-e1964]|nr:MAG: hypothetical protein M1829_006899 [Trizodia sp. TS-e1964]